MDVEFRKKALRMISYGVYVITSKYADQYSASTITWVSQASFEPPMISICLKNKSNSYQIVKKREEFLLHLLGEDQKNMANEILRIGKRFYVQTPNYWFPIEPHFLCPFFQYFPIWVKGFLLRSFNLGWYSRTTDKEESLRIAKSIRLLTLKEMNALFPNSHTYKEKFYGFVKSFTKYGESL